MSTRLAPYRSSPLAAARLQRGLSQTELAERAGVGRGAVSLAERHGVCSPRTRKLLARALEVEPGALLTVTP